MSLSYPRLPTGMRALYAAYGAFAELVMSSPDGSCKKALSI